ncbi:MAG: biotin carboxylase [SAR324 cluster bacterium]|nr:biotin carboxylase [SAR324 cluster bacterium]
MQAFEKKTPARGAKHENWWEQFRFDHVKVLVVCRGPIRLEAVTTFDRLGAQPSGILLSQKDSVIYSRALAPELRHVGRNARVHRISDYGSSLAEGDKRQRIAEILEIAHGAGYTHLFAGYGFMAEDHEFIKAIEDAGLGFVGPSSQVVRRAGAKDAAKSLARSLGVSVIPGLDNVAALTLLAKSGKGDEAAHLRRLVRKQRLRPAAGWEKLPPAQAAEAVLQAAVIQGKALLSLPELQAEAKRQAARLLKDHPGMRLRLKHVEGGGGKGQRIVSAAQEVPNAVFEVLSESRAMGPADNKNFLMELNVEDARHNEIQLLGNGEWCIALGGRDCSLQMHEQKLLEVSITAELLESSATRYQAEGKLRQARVLRDDMRVLAEMESEAERIGTAVGLDSASTFESIVHGKQHYFMEINTRVQVEHRVTEMVYGLRFSNPSRPEQSFQVDSLVEAMLRLTVHGQALPRPERVPRHGSGAEARVNATNDALQPHAGGVVLDWSPPVDDELRDDQGIGIPNPDTGTFMPYHLAGAYDSNAALVVTHGENREHNFSRLAEILRRMEVRGDDVLTNRAFHYGLLRWMLGHEPMVKPSTRFVGNYLAAVGALRTACREVHLEEAWALLSERVARLGDDAAQSLADKITLVMRPLHLLYRHPHLMAGWLAPWNPRRWTVDRGKITWHQNPLAVLELLYFHLLLENRPGVSPEEKIWEQDQRLLRDGLDFYGELHARLGPAVSSWHELCVLLKRATPPKGFTSSCWVAVRASHRGYQIGLELLALPILSGEESGFAALKVNERLEPVLPQILKNKQLIEEYHTALAPPLPVSGNRILAWSGGTFYARPSPHSPPYVQEGIHIEAGEVVGLLEVMKMFNPLRAEFSGTVTKVLVSTDGGVIVRKGQGLLEVEPDVPLSQESEAQIHARRLKKTRALVAMLQV